MAQPALYHVAGFADLTPTLLLKYHVHVFVAWQHTCLHVSCETTGRRPVLCSAFPLVADAAPLFT